MQSTVGCGGSRGSNRGARGGGTGRRRKGEEEENMSLLPIKYKSKHGKE